MFTYTLRIVTIGGVLLGALSGIIGSFAVLRKQSLMGDALSHAALPGVGIAFLVAGRDLEYLLIGAGIASLLGVGFISLITKMTRLKQDSAMGIVLSGWFALGIGVFSFIQQHHDSSQAGLNSFIFGQAAAIVQQDVYLLVGVVLVMFIILIINWKEFKIITFDPEFARAIGLPVGAYTALLMSMIVITVVMGLQLAGIILMAGLLIAPGIAARQWTDRLELMVGLAGIIGGGSGAVGAMFSALDADIPTGPMIIVTVSFLVLISILFAPRRGILWVKLKQQRDRLRFVAQNVRKTTWRYVLSHARNPENVTPEEAEKLISREFLVGLLGPATDRGIRQLLDTGELEQIGKGYRLSADGRRRAMQERADSPGAEYV